MAHSAVHIWKTRKTSILGIALICVTLASLDAESRAKTESRYSGYLAKLSQPKTAKSSKEIAESPEEVAANKIPAGLIHLGGNSNYYSPYAFVVDKKARTLAVWHQDKDHPRQVAIFPADMGKNWGEKQSSGDARTPEGIYFLQAMMEGPSLDFSQYGKRAYTTDYPNFFDRTDGKTGSGIWLHAVPDQVPLTRGSHGCVVVRNKVITDLGQFITLEKTPILINESIEYADNEELKERSNQIGQMIEEWRQSWAAKDIDRYISFYAENFRSQKMNRDQWKEFKGRLNQTYKTLNVKFSQPVIYSYKGKTVARFLQSYASDQHADFGEKTLYLKEESAKFKIIGEDWRADESPLARQEFNGTASATAVSACTAPNDCSPQATAAHD